MKKSTTNFEFRKRMDDWNTIPEAIELTCKKN
ncbi:hypothetical protein HL670_01768 [Serratia plymuthica]|nr:hypothetical protein HL670_01768 [Serratia plymuthica]